MRVRDAASLLLACMVVNARAQQAQGADFQALGTYVALGGLMATTVAPGPTAGSQRLYGSYLYADNTLDVVAVDPANGAAEVFHNVVPGEYGARNIAVGPDGDVYLGSLPHAHFLRIDRKAHTMVDLGRPSPNEEYIWDVAFGADGKLYGVTYPGCRLVRYDPATHALQDLGRMDPTEKYGRWIVGGHDGFMYIGIGTAKANIAVYDTRTGEMREVLPAAFQTADIAKPYLGADGKVYATVGDRLFSLDGFSLREIPAQSKVAPANPDVLKNGDVLDLAEGGGTLTVTNPRTHAERQLQIDYKGEQLQVFRIGFGPDGQLYGSAILPIRFLRVDPAKKQIDKIGDLGGGEVYSFLAHDGKLLMGAYSGMSPLMTYTPGAAFAPSPQGNPLLVNYAESDHAWRPQAMIAGSDGRVYVGATAGYGKLEAPLLAWTGAPGSVQLIHNLAADQSPVSLTAWKQAVIAGTTTLGGGGSHPAAIDAHVYTWDTTTRAKTNEAVPVPGAKTITDLVTARSGLVYGIAVAGPTHTLFRFDPTNGRVVSTSSTPFHNMVYNGIGVTPAGTIVGLAEHSIFTVDESKGQVREIVKTPMPITGGFALRDGYVYFISNATVYRYRLGDAHVR